MTLRLIGTLLGSQDTLKGCTVRIYRDAERNEFRARLFVDGKVYAPADYHTDDLDDAWDTGMRMLEPTLR